MSPQILLASRQQRQNGPPPAACTAREEPAPAGLPRDTVLRASPLLLAVAPRARCFCQCITFSSGHDSTGIRFTTSVRRSHVVHCRCDDKIISLAKTDAGCF